jgi:hypothetical protein
MSKVVIIEGKEPGLPRYQGPHTSLFFTSSPYRKVLAEAGEIRRDHFQIIGRFEQRDKISSVKNKDRIPQLYQEMPIQAPAYGMASIDRPAVNRIPLSYLAITGHQVQGRALRDQDITCGIFRKIFNDSFKVDHSQQRIVVLVVYLPPEIVADRSSKGRHPNPAARVPEHFQYLHIGQTVLCRKIPEMCPVEPAYSRLGPCPDETVLILGDAIDRRASQSFRDVIVSIAVFLGKGAIRQKNDKKGFQQKDPHHITL